MAMNIFKEVEKGNLPGLKRAISLYPNSVNARNAAGDTPLHVAAGLGQVAFVKELLVHGAQYDSTDSQGNIPLHLAAEQGFEETVSELLAGRKTTAKAKNKEGQTPLHLAVNAGNKAAVLKLLEANNRTDVKDKAGNTPLSLAEDEEMRQILTTGRPPSTEASVGQRVAQNARGADGTSGNPRVMSAPGTAIPLASNSNRVSLPSAPSLVSSDGGGGALGTPVTPRFAGATNNSGRTPPPSLAVAQGLPTGARTPPPVLAGTPAVSQAGRMPRNPASPSVSGGGTGSAGGSGPAAGVQQQKYDAAIQSLKEGLRAATERLGALDACTAAQLECAGQVERALEACGNNGRAILDLEARLTFQEERGRDSRLRLERLEEGERDRQDSIKRLTDDHRSLSAQLQRLADKVAANSSSPPQQQELSGNIASHQSGQPQLQVEVSVLRAQLDQLSPALALATSASAEARTLAARLDVMQQQLQQQQHPAAQQQGGGNLVLEQQVLQLQAQVQLLQLPVASLTQQCADLSSRMAGMAEWQQQSRAELAKLAEAAEQSAGDRLTDAVMGVLDTTARSLNELRQQQDDTAKQVALLLQQQRQQAAVPASPLPSVGPPALPATPQAAGGSQRVSGTGDLGTGPFGGPPSRNLNGLSSFGTSIGRDSVAQAELRAELESLKSLVTDIRKEVATEGGSLRREWQRAFSDMQSRYGEQTNELRAREANIAKLREAALVEEAERRAASGFEDKFSARLGKLETNVEYLTHRLEVLEEQVSGVVSSLAGATSPVAQLSPSHMAAALAAMRSQPATLRTGPGPVSENHSGVALSESGLTSTVAMVTSALSPESPPKHSARCRSAAGPARPPQNVTAGMKSEGGCLRVGGPVLGMANVKGPGPSGGCAGENTAAVGAASLHEDACAARITNEHGLESEQWWQAANAAPPEQLGEAADAPTGAESGCPPITQDADGGVTPAQQPVEAARADAGTILELQKGGVTGPRYVGWSAPGGDTQGKLSARADLALAHTLGGTAAVSNSSSARDELQEQPGGNNSSMAYGKGPFWREGAEPVVTQREPASARSFPSARGGATPRPQAAQPGLGGGGIPDPASVTMGPQLLMPAAHALLSPSVDIQRLAVAVHQHQNAQHWHQQGVLAQQPGSMAAPPWIGGQQQSQQAGAVAASVGGWGADGAGGTVGSIGPALVPPPDRRGKRQDSSLEGPSRKEPPMCLFCPMQ